MNDSAVPAATAANPSRFDLRPLLAANLACTMAMMSFVAVVGPLARVLGLAPWQAGVTVTVSGLLWMLLARPWGMASDRHGRRPVLLLGVGGVALSFLAMCVVLDVSLHVLPAAWLAFVGVLSTRTLVGAFYAAIPATAQALIADHVEPARRASAMASLGAAGAVGMVGGPALAALLSQRSLSLPLYATALLPVAAWLLLWRSLPRQARTDAAPPQSLRLADPRLARPMAVAFGAMAVVGIAQITVGFFALDRFGLEPAAAARLAGLSLTAVGVALIVAQVVVKWLGWPPERMIRVGALVCATGFTSVAGVDAPWMLTACYAVAAFGMGWVFPAFAALAANAVGSGEQGAAAGAVGAAQGLGIVVGPLGGTLLYSLSSVVPYLACGALLVVLAVWPARRKGSA